MKYKRISSLTSSNIYLKNLSGAYLWLNTSQLKIARLNYLNEIIDKTNYDLYDKKIAEYVSNIDQKIMFYKKEETLEEYGVDEQGASAVYERSLIHWEQQYQF